MTPDVLQIVRLRRSMKPARAAAERAAKFVTLGWTW
jgi:hypothetical protein